MTGRVRGRARVQVTIEVLLDQSWGPESTLHEVYTRAQEEATMLLSRKLHSGQGFSIIGTPKTLAILTAEEET